MWTATILNKAKKDGRISIFVEFSDGTEKFMEEFTANTSVDMTWLKNVVRNRLDTLMALYTFADSLVNSSVVDVTPPAAPTQAELDRIQFLKDYARRVQIKKAIDVGLFDGTETAVVNQLNQLKTDFKPAYLNFI